MTFTGFDPGGLAVLDELPTWSAERYADRSAELKAGVTEPGWELIQDVADALPVELTVARRSSVSPLHADLRFAKDGAPRYKDHLLLTTWHGDDKRSGATMWLRIDATRAGLASGIGLDGRARDRWRAAVADEHGATLDRALTSLRQRRPIDVAGEKLARIPSPYPSDHPRGELLRHRGIQVRWSEQLPGCVTSAAFSGWCAERLAELLPIHRWLVEHVEER